MAPKGTKTEQNPENERGEAWEGKQGLAEEHARGLSSKTTRQGTPWE